MCVLPSQFSLSQNDGRAGKLYNKKVFDSSDKELPYLICNEL